MTINAITLSLATALMVPAANTFGQNAGPGQSPDTPEPFAVSPEVPERFQVPAQYVIGPDDVLSIVFWRDDDLSAEVVVRPDGRISLPLLNDVQAAGLTPDQLRLTIVEAATRYVEEPTASVVVAEINSRRVFITGQVAVPGEYAMTGPMRVVQLIAAAGGLLDFADADNVRILRTEGLREVSYRFNYKHVLEGKNLLQNIQLMPGDTVLVP